MPHQSSRAIILVLVSPPPPQQARGRCQATRGRSLAVRVGCQDVRGWGRKTRTYPRGIVLSGRAQPWFYAFPTRLNPKTFNVVIIGIVPIFYRNTSVLFYLGSTYSYVQSYFDSYLVMPLVSLSAPMYVSMHVGDFIVVDRVYRLYVVTIWSLETSMDLLFQDMVDLDVILGMD